MTGTIKMLSDRGFGFIKPDDGSKDVFVHVRDAEAAGIGELTEGMRLRYEEVLDQRSGKYRAASLELL
jgi:CspA family cold shock protein